MRPAWDERHLSQTYWNAHLETLPREQLDAMHLRRLKALTRYALERSPFYQAKFRAAGVELSDLRTLDDFKRLPLTDKDEFLDFQDQQPHYGHTGALPEEYLSMHCETSGTTGQRLRIPLTLYDTERYGESWVYGWWAMGIRPHDSFYFAFNWGLFAGFWSAYWGVRRLGAKLYSGGGQDSAGHIRQILRLQPTVLISTPTYALHLANEARKMGVDLAASSVRYTYHAGEPGPCALPAVRERLDREWGAISGELLGVAELDALAPGCPTRTGVHMNEANVFSWSRDPVTGQEVGEGEVGENIVTSFVNTAQPLINYRTHDLVRRRSACACGRSWDFLDGVVLGRTDFMLTVRGTNVYPSAVEALLGQVSGVSSYYRMLLTRDDSGLDQMTVEFEAVPGAVDDPDELARTVSRRLREAIGVRIDARSVPEGSLPRPELKTQRVVDQRPREVRRALEAQSA
jgi:phenylacetate-CoA ligase